MVPRMRSTSSVEPIVAGRGWRALVIGASLAEVSADLGPPSHLRRYDEFLCVDWRPLGLRAYLSLDERVTVVTAIFREIYVEGFTPFPGTTERGIGFSSTLAEVEAAHGMPPERRGNKADTFVYEGMVVSFHEDALLKITIDPTNGPRVKAPLPPPHPFNERGARALQLVAGLERRIAELGNPEVRVVLTPCERSWLENFEQRIGHRLPPSYRQLALERGTLHVEVEGRTTVWLVPVVQLGGPGPTSWAGEGVEEVDDAVNRAICFAYESDDAVENFYTFDPAHTDEHGEMAVGLYYHDERYRGGGGMTFAGYLERSIERLFEYYLS